LVTSRACRSNAKHRHRLRHETREGGLATIEAIARALGVLEGGQVRSILEKVFCAMVERTLWSRGQLDAAQVSAGIPAGVLRHDPRSGLSQAPRVPTAP
jgi:hypothetical protein